MKMSWIIKESWQDNKLDFHYPLSIFHCASREECRAATSTPIHLASKLINLFDKYISPQHHRRLYLCCLLENFFISFLLPYSSVSDSKTILNFNKQLFFIKQSRAKVWGAQGKTMYYVSLLLKWGEEKMSIYKNTRNRKPHFCSFAEE